MRSELMNLLVEMFSDRGVEVRELSDEADLSESMDWDSMDYVDFLMEVRERHGLNLPDKLPAYTVGGLLRAMEEAAGAAPSA